MLQKYNFYFSKPQEPIATRHIYLILRKEEPFLITNELKKVVESGVNRIV